jgi:hypothetical protein
LVPLGDREVLDCPCAEKDGDQGTPEDAERGADIGAVDVVRPLGRDGALALEDICTPDNSHDGSQLDERLCSDMQHPAVLSPIGVVKTVDDAVPDITNQPQLPAPLTRHKTTPRLIRESNTCLRRRHEAAYRSAVLL